MGRKKRLTLNEMKSYILDCYPNSIDFRRRVTNEMKPRQIVAIYMSLVSSKKKKGENKDYHQMDLWEWIIEQNEKQEGFGTHSKIRV